MTKYTHSTRLKVLAGLFAFLASVSLLQQVGGTDTFTILASATTVTKEGLSPRELARKAVREKLAKTRPARKRILRGKVVERFRRPRPVLSEAPPPIIPTSSENVPEKSRCGDQIILLSEQCDDGNTQSEDGCSADCKIEAGFTCYGQPSVCIERCGDGNISTKEKCDDGNLDNNDGCSSLCRVEFGYSCTGTPSACKIIPVCGNRVLEAPETCDDGNVIVGDGCSATCVKE